MVNWDDAESIELISYTERAQPIMSEFYSPSDRKVRVFKISQSFLDQFAGKQPEWGYGGLGYFIFKRTYARTQPDGTTEEFRETCRRVVEGVYNIQKRHCWDLKLPWDEAKAQNSAQEMYTRMWQFKFLPPGRGLWGMGTDIVEKKGSACLMNCGLSSTKDIDVDFAGPFCFLMDFSMLGVGISGDVRGAGKVKIQVPRYTDKPYVVDDSREGWVELLRVVLNSFVGKGFYPTSIDYSQIRPAGSPLKTFGGVSAGPDPLINLIGDLTGLLTPADGEPYKITTATIVDIYNLIGKCVVSGGLRRTAEAMFGEPDDEEFMSLKQDKAKLNSHRWCSNNSILAKVGMDYSRTAELAATNGEPGFFWLENARAYARMRDKPNYVDARVMGANPCFAGSTLIAVADGRGAVPIRQLADEGDDILVYSLTAEGRVEVQIGRHPRMTRMRAKFMEVVLDDGAVLKVTPDHKMVRLDGTKCEAKDMKVGDSLPRFTKRPECIVQGKDRYLRVNCNTLDCTADKVYEHRLVAKFMEPDKWARMYDAGKVAGWVKGGIVVHHRDYNPLNNAPSNLEIMYFEDHERFHGQRDNVGVRNPMWGRRQSDETRAKIGAKSKERCKDPEYRKKLGFHTEAQRVRAARAMSEWRRRELAKYYQEIEATTELETTWVDGCLQVVCECKICGQKRLVPWGRRSTEFCSRSCMNKNAKHIQKRTVGLRRSYAARQQQVRHNQVSTYKELQVSLGREPLKREWENECRRRGVAFRFQGEGHTQNPFAVRGFRHLKALVGEYNHTVKALRFLDDEEPAYNLSVDVNHTVGIVTAFDPVAMECGGIFTPQCMEQTLTAYECCCLVESFPANHDTLEDFKRTLKFAYLYAKTVTLVPTHDLRANAVAMRNRRIGCSQSGIVQAMAKLGRREYLRWCDEGYRYVAELDKIYSEWLCIPRSIKTTSVKPSGSISLVVGATPGIHYPHAEYYIRNVRVADISPLVKACRKAGYLVEADKCAPETSVVSFPIHEKNFSKSKKDVTIWEQMMNAADLQREWSDNAVSISVSFQPHEVKDIKTCLEAFETRLKGVSFVPLKDHGYEQAPYIEITKEEYEKLVKRIKPLNLCSAVHEETEKFCSNDTCTLSCSVSPDGPKIV